MWFIGSSLSPHNLLLHIINFRFNIIYPYGICFVLLWEEIQRQLLFFSFLIFFFFFLTLIRWYDCISNPREVVHLFFLGRIPGCKYTRSHCQILISCTISRRSPLAPTHIYSYTLFPLICCIRLQYDWSFRLYHHIIYPCYLVVSYLFLLKHCLSLWHSFRRDSVSLLRFPFLSHVHVFSCDSSLVRRLKISMQLFFSPIFVFSFLLFSWSLCCFCYFW